MIERGKLRVHYFRHKEIKNLLCLINSHFIRRWELKGSVFQFQHMKCARVLQTLLQENSHMAHSHYPPALGIQLDSAHIFWDTTTPRCTPSRLA